MKITSKLFLIPLMVIYTISYAQTKSEKIVSNYFTKFFQSQKTIDFLQSNKDSVIVAYDVDSILTKSGTIMWGNKKLKVITVGENISRIKKDGIFTWIRDSTDFIIVSQNTIDRITYYRVFRPRTGADGHYTIKKIKGRYIKQEVNYGCF